MLIDIVKDLNCEQRFIDGKYYLTKPYKFYSGYTFKKRFKDCLSILTGKAFAVNFKEDE